MEDTSVDDQRARVAESKGTPEHAAEFAVLRGLVLERDGPPNDCKGGAHVARITDDTPADKARCDCGAFSFAEIEGMIGEDED